MRRTALALSLLFLATCAPAGEAPPPAPQPGPGEGAMCGGIAGLGCGDGLYCDYGVGQCRIPDGSGVCRPKPEACTMEYAPVCGCDGVTYGNACSAASAGVTVAAQGECP